MLSMLLTDSLILGQARQTVNPPSYTSNPLSTTLSTHSLSLILGQARQTVNPPLITSVQSTLQTTQNAPSQHTLSTHQSLYQLTLTPTQPPLSTHHISLYHHPHPHPPLNSPPPPPPQVSEVLKAAAWIVGEYSEIVSLVAHDTAAVSENLENDNGYWIEGPTGEDIRWVSWGTLFG